MALPMKTLAILSLITSLAPAVAFSQSCTVAQVSQEFSYEDTFNSSGSALGDAYAVFQQDRFYVNQQGRLDPNDKPDPIMVNREARANYGQAIRAYMNANGMGDMPAQVLVGSQYTVEIEACGSQDNPSIRVLSMRMGGDIEDDSWELELEYREAELAEWELEREYREAELADWEQRLNQREADLNQWERQLSEWDRRLSDMQYNLEQSDQETVAPQSEQPAAAPASSDDVTPSISSFSAGENPIFVVITNPDGTTTEFPLSACYGYLRRLYESGDDEQARSALATWNEFEPRVLDAWIRVTAMNEQDWDAGVFSGVFTYRFHAEQRDYESSSVYLRDCNSGLASFIEAEIN